MHCNYTGDIQNKKTLDCANTLALIKQNLKKCSINGCFTSHPSLSALLFKVAKLKLSLVYTVCLPVRVVTIQRIHNLIQITVEETHRCAS